MLFVLKAEVEDSLMLPTIIVSTSSLHM